MTKKTQNVHRDDLEGYGNVTIRYSACIYDFLFRNDVPTLYRFRNTVVELRTFLPTCILRPRWGGPIRILPISLAPEKTRVSGLGNGVVCVILCLAVLIELRLVNDGQTDGHITDTAYSALA